MRSYANPQEYLISNLYGFSPVSENLQLRIRFVLKKTAEIWPVAEAQIISDFF